MYSTHVSDSRATEVEVLGRWQLGSVRAEQSVGLAHRAEVGRVDPDKVALSASHVLAQCLSIADFISVGRRRVRHDIHDIIFVSDGHTLKRNTVHCPEPVGEPAVHPCVDAGVA